MKKALVFLLALIVLGGVPVLGLASHPESCAGDDPGDPGTGGVASVDTASGSGSGRLTVRSCDDMEPDGNTTVAASGPDRCAYVALDGDPSNTTDLLSNEPPFVGPGGDGDLNGHWAVQADADGPVILAVLKPTSDQSDYTPTCPTP